MKNRYKGLIWIMYGIQLEEFREYIFYYLNLDFNNIGFNTNTFFILDVYCVYVFEILLFIVLLETLNSSNKKNISYICKKCKKEVNLNPCEYCNKNWYNYLEKEYKKF